MYLSIYSCEHCSRGRPCILLGHQDLSKWIVIIPNGSTTLDTFRKSNMEMGNLRKPHIKERFHGKLIYKLENFQQIMFDSLRINHPRHST